jgi:CDP-paratose synthetase
MLKLPKVLLTGATGFLGSHLLGTLINKGYEVVILKRSSSNIYRIQDKIDSVISYDLDMQPLELAFKEQNIDVVIHTAGRYGRDGCSIAKIVETNVVFGIGLLEACQKYNTNIFINADTILQSYLNCYSLSKKHFVDWLKQHSEGIQVINLRLEHMYGTKDDDSKFVSWVLSQLKAGTSKIELTTGEQKRDFIFIDDVVSAFLIVLEKSEKLPQFSEFDVGTGRSISVRKFVEKIALLYQEINPKSKTKLLFGTIPYRKGEVMNVYVDITGLQKIGWQPKTSLNDGLSRIIRE